MMTDQSSVAKTQRECTKSAGSQESKENFAYSCFAINGDVPFYTWFRSPEGRSCLSRSLLLWDRATRRSEYFELPSNKIELPSNIVSSAIPAVSRSCCRFQIYSPIYELTYLCATWRSAPGERREDERARRAYSFGVQE